MTPSYEIRTILWFIGRHWALFRNTACLFTAATREQCVDYLRTMQHQRRLSKGSLCGTHAAPHLDFSRNESHPDFPRNQTSHTHRRTLTRQERLQGLADRGCDTWEEYREER